MLLNRISEALPEASNQTPKTASKALGQAFLEEMIKYIHGDSKDSYFSGGIGEEQFKSFLNREYAKQLSEKIDFNFDIDKL